MLTFIFIYLLSRCEFAAARIFLWIDVENSALSLWKFHAHANKARNKVANKFAINSSDNEDASAALIF